MGARVVAGSANNKTTTQLARFLSDNGCHVVGVSEDGHDFLRRIHTVYPDLAIIDSSMKGLGSRELTEILLAEGVCPVIVLASDRDRLHYLNLEQDPMLVLLEKPLNRGTMLNTIEILVKMAKSISRLEREVKQLRSKQEVKELTGRAKKLLMQHENLTEEEAHRKIQRESMNRGLGKEKVAEGIILKYGS